MTVSVATPETVAEDGAHARPVDGSPASPAEAAPTPRAVWAALVGVAAAAAVVYAWGITRSSLHEYYSPAVKSMSENWKAFFYGAYDPAASITLDKLPGAFQVQALSARLFGFHAWSVLAPQVVEAVITVVVLFVVVRRWRGPTAGLLAATFYAVTPIVAALAHAEIADTLLVMLLVLAAAAWQRAVQTAELRALILCAVLVGLAFHVKMVQAWGVLPAFALVYLIAAPTTLRRRFVHVGLSGLVTGAVSMAWVALVLLTPASSRPYVDGTTNNSPLSMIFDYNLFSRYGVDDGTSVGGGPTGGGGFGGTGGGWSYLFGDGITTQVGWLYPLALVGLLLGVWWRGRAARTDAARTGFLMWGLWLLVHGVAFSAGRVAHSFYVVAMAPALAALAGAGLVTLWTAYREGTWRRWALPVTVAASAAWIAYLSMGFETFRPWITPVTVAAGVAGVLALVTGTIGRRSWARRAALVGAALATLTVLVAPTTWAASTVDAQYVGTPIGPVAGPVMDNPGAARGGPVRAVGPAGSGPEQSGPVMVDPGSPVGPGVVGGGPKVFNRSTGPDTAVAAILTYLRAHQSGERYLLAASGAQLAGQFILSGASVLPIGGFSGRVPFPTADGLAGLVASGQLRFVLTDTGGDALRGGPDAAADSELTTWVTAHCTAVDSTAIGAAGEIPGTLYDCRAGGA
jgi:4-amino-4-deoxy-L-arabinose transferase-like glycosyltransferase